MTLSPELAAEALKDLNWLDWIYEEAFRKKSSDMFLRTHFYTLRAALEQVANPPRGEEPEAVKSFRLVIGSYQETSRLTMVRETALGTLAHIDAQQSRIAKLDKWIETIQGDHKRHLDELLAQIEDQQEKIVNMAIEIGALRYAAKRQAKDKSLIAEQQAEIERLKEIEWMYKDLQK